MTAEQHSIDKMRKCYLLTLYQHSFWLDNEDMVHAPVDPYGPRKNAHSQQWLSMVLRGQSNVNTLYNLMHLSQKQLENEHANVAIQLRAYELDNEQLTWLIPLYNCIFFALKSIDTPCFHSHHIDEIMATHRFCTAPPPLHGIDITQKVLLFPRHMVLGISPG
jgi:hypothetical protein